LMPIPLYPTLSFSIVSHRASLHRLPYRLSTCVWVVLYLFFLLISLRTFQVANAISLSICWSSSSSSYFKSVSRSHYSFATNSYYTSVSNSHFSFATNSH
jgi:hypothetical protein